MPTRWREGQHQGGEPEIGRRQTDDGGGAAGVVARGVLPHRRVDAHRHGDHQPDEDGQDTQLDGDRQPPDDLRLDGSSAEQRVAQGAAQEDAAQPAHVLHRRRHIEPEHALNPFAVQVCSAAYFLPQPGHHEVDDVAGEEAHREKHQERQLEECRDQQQDAADDVGSHGRVSTLGRRPAPPSHFVIWPTVKLLRQKPSSRFRSWSSQRRVRTVVCWIGPSPISPA